MAQPDGSALSPEQAALLADTARVVEAGPGSGKTRALVGRFVVRASAARRGVALLSFTNAAVDEARSRCANTPHLLRAPHFIGTIDSFLHRYIVTPTETRRLGHLPSYRRSWDELPDTYSSVRLNGIVGAGIPLSSFRLDAAGSVAVNPELGWEARTYLIQVQNAGRMANLQTRVKSVINGLTRMGVYDAASARRRALQLLSGAGGEALLDRLALRFGEVMVDEAQDCDDAEFAILRLLRAKGVKVVVVADPDQAIYEFRGGDPGLFLAYSNEHPPEARIQLGTNYRSSIEICKAVSVLRAAGTATIKASQPGTCCPVFVLAGTPQEQGVKFRQILNELGIAVSEAVVVSHGRADAIAVAGGGPTAGSSAAAGNRLAAACAQLRPGRGDAATRLAAVKSIEDIVLSLLDWPTEMEPMGREAKLARLDRRPDWLRQSAGAIAANLQELQSRDDFGSRGRALLVQVLGPLNVPVVDLGQRLKKPTTAVWEVCQVVEAAAGSLRADTIHGVKGTESRGVLVALPDGLRKTDGKDVLDNLDDGANTEARRVLYVGASRAMTVLAFGAGPHTARLAALLAAGGVNTETR